MLKIRDVEDRHAEMIASAIKEDQMGWFREALNDTSDEEEVAIKLALQTILMFGNYQHEDKEEIIYAPFGKVLFTVLHRYMVEQTQQDFDEYYSEIAQETSEAVADQRYEESQDNLFNHARDLTKLVTSGNTY